MIFLDLGYQPLANRYRNFKKKKFKELKYRLLVNFNFSSQLVSIKKKFSSKTMFSNTYPYRSSMSKTMLESFKKLAIKIKKNFLHKKVLEIGCNDGIFLKNFNQFALGIEPCKNIANIARKKDLNVISDYWTTSLAKKILKKHGTFDIIYSANTITHIKDLNEVFKAINIVLNKSGILIIEDPSLLECIKKNTYDQFYNEHIYLFSLLSLTRILNKYKLRTFKVENIKVHGGSNRYYICKSNNKIKNEVSVLKQKKRELIYSLDKIQTYKKFGVRVKKSKDELLNIFKKIKSKKKRVIGYGASAKAVTILNYCKINTKYIDYFVDTTPEKQNKILPGVDMLIKKYNKKSLKDIHYVFLY